MNENEALWDTLKNGIIDFMNSTGFNKVIIGESGGLDSALVTILAAEALGPNNVQAITMPSVHSSKETLEDALRLCENLQLPCKTIPIQPLVESFLKVVELDGIALENLQSRIRGVLLMEWSNQHGGIVLCPSNKSEAAMGYSTLYGDTVGSYAPIADVYKTRLYQLAWWWAENNPGIIPETIITRAPSAELAPNQKDEDSLPPYHVLDSILMKYVEEGAPKEKVVETFGEVGDETIKRLHRNAWKREQEPNGIKVSTKTLTELDQGEKK